MDVYPLPRIDEILDTLGAMEYFTTLDQANAYWLIPIEEGDRHNPAFNTLIGLFEFKYVPFGICNAPASFMRLMDVVLAGLQWNTCMVYLDDILVYAKSFPEMLERISQVFERLAKDGLKLRLSKCKFCLSEIEYLGHKISHLGIPTG